VPKAATTVEDMSDFLAEALPGFNASVQVVDSSLGKGLGLVARRDFKEGDVLYAWGVDDGTVMVPVDKFADQLASEDFGALALQVLKKKMSDRPNAFKAWLETGVEAPEVHPLRLVTEDAGQAKMVWSSTTCGARMSAAALALREDVEALSGQVEIEEWAATVALVMSRTIVTEDDGKPLLVLGLDLVQDGEDPNVEARCVYTQVNAGMFGDGGELELSRIVFVAKQDILAGEELTAQYLESPHGGRYLEQYGFIPSRLRGELSDGAVELVFEPSDEEEDFHYYNKESMLENIDMKMGPMSFIFTTDDDLIQLENGLPWEYQSTLDRMSRILRLRFTGGAESYLIDSVYVDALWDNCAYAISKENELNVCEYVINECNMWLKRFAAQDEANEPESEIQQLAADLRRTEKELLERVRDVFVQEQKETKYDETRKYWADRQLDVVFPERASRGGLTGVEGFD